MSTDFHKFLPGSKNTKQSSQQIKIIMSHEVFKLAGTTTQVDKRDCYCTVCMQCKFLKWFSDNNEGRKFGPMNLLSTSCSTYLQRMQRGWHLSSKSENSGKVSSLAVCLSQINHNGECRETRFRRIRISATPIREKNKIGNSTLDQSELRPFGDDFPY